MLAVDDQAAGPHDASLDHERIVLEARDVKFDWADLPAALTRMADRRTTGRLVVRTGAHHRTSPKITPPLPR